MSDTPGTPDPDDEAGAEPALQPDDEAAAEQAALAPQDNQPQAMIDPSQLPVRTGAVGSAIADLPVIPPDIEMRALAQLANTLAMAEAVPKALRRKPNDVFLVLLSARDLGVALTTAMREFHVIEGTVTLSPKVKLAMVRHAKLGRCWPARQNTANSATWTAYRFDAPDEVVEQTFGWADAQMAGLVDTRCSPTAHWKGNNQSCMCKDNWKRYPQRMVSWRALGYLLDDVFGEVATGMYSPDELGAITDAEGEPIDVAGVAALPGMKGGRQQDPPAEDQAPDEFKRETTIRISKLTAEARAEFNHWWKGEVRVKVADLPARLVAKVTARLDWMEAQPGAVEQVTAEDGATSAPEGEAAQQGADEAAGAQESQQAPESDPQDTTPEGWAIAHAKAQTLAGIKAEFRAEGLKPPSGAENKVRLAYATWVLGRVATPLLVQISAMWTCCPMLDAEELAEALAELVDA